MEQERKILTKEELDTCRLYLWGGITALLTLPLYLWDTIISLTMKDISTHLFTAVDWFYQCQNNPLLALRMLGLLNIITLLMTLPMYYSIYIAHRNKYNAASTLTLLLYLIGLSIYISNNAAIPLFVISGKYYSVAEEAQRVIFTAAGEAILARGADFTPGSFVGFILTEIAGIAFSILMLRGKIFGKAEAYCGITGLTCLSIFTICSTFLPGTFSIVIVIAMIGGIASVVWYVLVGRRLLHFSKGRLVNKVA